MRKLDPEERIRLESVLRETKDPYDRDRIRVIIALDNGYPPSKIADILRISERTVYGYLKAYEEEGRTAHEPHPGKPCKLSPTQEVELKDYLAKVTYKSAKYVCVYVLDRYGIQYTIAGMTDWLLRNGFVYKKPMKIPKKLDPEKQEAFVKKYHELKEHLKEGELILFMDATHPEYQSQSSYGWILKGEIKTLTTTTKQERVHFLGAIELNQMQIIAQEYETVNADSTVDFLKKLEEKIPATKIYLICDNASPNRCKKVQGYVKNSKRIEIHYLPPYSPNLNPIERLWKVMREEVTYNKMHKEFKDFSNAMREFFYEKVKQLKQLLRRRINDNFQKIHINPLQTSI
jgi:transposase